MTIKNHIILSAAITIALIAVIACQQKIQSPKNKEHNENVIKKEVKEIVNVKEENIAQETELEAKNLLLNSDFSEGLKGWLNTKGVKVIEEEGRNCVELLGIENDQIRIWQNINTTSGHVYRLTFKVKALQDTAFAIFRDNLTGKEQYLMIDPLDDWTKKSKSFESKRDGVYNVFLSCLGKGKFYYSDITLIDVTTYESKQK